MIDRLVIVAAVLIAVLALGFVTREWAARRRAKVIDRLHLDREAGGSARILSFYGPSCDACDRQKVVLSELASDRLGTLTIDLRDASNDYETARRFGLVIVPTTVVIKADGAIAAINSGFTARPILEAQLDAA